MGTKSHLDGGLFVAKIEKRSGYKYTKVYCSGTYIIQKFHHLIICEIIFRTAPESLKTLKLLRTQIIDAHSQVLEQLFNVRTRTNFVIQFVKLVKREETRFNFLILKTNG
jgi:hypothetical protein